jgi:predicted O-methyltransferase YrrM
MEAGDIKILIADIDGWLTDNEGKLLRDLAEQCRGRGAIVEIGSWKGKSTIWLAKGSKNGSRVRIYAIDPHIGSESHQEKFGKVWTFKEFQENIKKAEVDDIVIPIVKTSAEAAESFEEPVELIFIDGSHDYDMVKLDFECWYPKLVDGGIMAFHDTIGWPGPRKVAREWMYKSTHFKEVRFVNTISYGKKVERNSLLDRIGNRFFLLLNDLNELASILHPLKTVRTILKKVF